LKLLKELAHIERKNDIVARKVERDKWKQVAKIQRSNYKKKK
jgi:ribosome biogenesis GTPase